MKIPIYQVDAFAERVFGGNPAAVCVLEKWLPDELLQSIAQENNLSETALLVDRSGSFEIRWFTPKNEVDLCGHATLAAAWVVLNRLKPESERAFFRSNSGELSVSREGERYVLHFPALDALPWDCPSDLEEILGVESIDSFQNTDVFVVVESEERVRNLSPRHDLLLPFSHRGVIVTAPGEEVDFVSRAFFPAVGINEDPVTGSTHCVLAPYWGEKLGKTELQARQLSFRQGAIECRLVGKGVELVGKAQGYLEGHIEVPV